VTSITVIKLITYFSFISVTLRASSVCHFWNSIRLQEELRKAKDKRARKFKIAHTTKRNTKKPKTSIAPDSDEDYSLEVHFMNVKDSSQETFTQEDSGEDSEEDSVSAVEAMYSDDEQQQSDAEDSEEEVNDYEEEVNDCEEENNKEESRNSSDDELLSTIPY